ncbi:MAG TPA: cbb3-type cytochrome c oxidase subunit 3 [Arenimonas sp.]|nr:cbb3-type cytochrome c oxidase subunit 3 [Arenimonas sp.]
MISGIITLVLLIAFIGGTAWAYSSKRKKDFNDAANIPLENDDEILP